MWQNKRSESLEILDLGREYYKPKEYHRSLQLLCRINWLLGGFLATKRAFYRLNISPKSILEVGCGGGYLCQYLKTLFPKAQILGIDISEEAISHADNHLPENFRSDITFRLQPTKALDYPDNSYDVVTTMLVCHHMSDHEIIEFLKEGYRVCSKALIINDLQRHVLAYFSFSTIAPFLFPNRLIWHDGRLSIKRSFRRKELVEFLEKAGFQESQYDLKWNWAFRWTLTVMKQ